MTNTQAPTTEAARSTFPPRPPVAIDPPIRQRRPSIQLLCVLALVIPLAAIGAWSHHAARTGTVTLAEMFLGPLLGGGTLIFWILFLHLVVCRDGLSALGLRTAQTRTATLREIGWGLALAAVLLAFHATFGATVARLFPPRPPAPQFVELLSGVARDPVLLTVWLGPVVWIGVALFEELARVFLLRRVWQVWRGGAGRWGGILTVSALVGLVHAYQGPAAIVSIGAQSVLLGWVFLRRGRIGALVISHALYDSVQIVFAVGALRESGLTG